MEDKKQIEELKDQLDALHMTYLSQVSLWKSMYNELKDKVDGKENGYSFNHFYNDRDKIADRKDYNKAILAKLGLLIEKYPEQRFGQLIANYIFPHYREKDIFYDESSETYNNLSV